MPQQLRLLDEAPRIEGGETEQLVIRESRRARRLILQLIPPHTLEMVVPSGTKPREIEAFWRESRTWLESARLEMRRRYPDAQLGPPDRIELGAIRRKWRVEYLQDASVRPRLRAFRDCLELTIPALGHRAAARMLRQWLMGESRRHLKPWLWREGQRVGLSPAKVQIRTQRTRWGSCSGQGTISLNAGLMFLEPPVARYLLVHELCHLRHLDHSPRFWRLVERFEPDYRALDRALSESWARVPAWVLTGS